MGDSHWLGLQAEQVVVALLRNLSTYLLRFNASFPERIRVDYRELSKFNLHLWLSP